MSYLRHIRADSALRVCDVQLACERCFTPVDERLHVAERDRHDVGDFLILEMAIVAEHERGPHFFRNARERRP